MNIVLTVLILCWYMINSLSTHDTLVRLILSLLRLKSVSSQPSPPSPGGWGAGSPLGRPGWGAAGGAFSWSLRCSSWRTSSVFSLSTSPPGMELTTALDQHDAKRRHTTMVPLHSRTLHSSSSHSWIKPSEGQGRLHPGSLTLTLKGLALLIL